MGINWFFIVVVIVISIVFINFLYHSFKPTSVKNRSYKKTVIFFAFCGPLFLSTPLAIVLGISEQSIKVAFFIIITPLLVGIIPAAIAGGFYHLLINKQLEKNPNINSYYKILIGMFSGFISALIIFGSAMMITPMNIYQVSIFIIISIISGGLCGRLVDMVAPQTDNI